VLRIWKLYFSFQGRLARAPFFIRSLYLGLYLVVLWVASIFVFANGGGLSWWAGIFMVAVMIAAFILGTLSLIVRPLHDLGLSSYHAIWVGAAEFALTFLSHGSPRVILLSLPLFAINLWLLFYPGKAAANRFGDLRA
jgi:uncharacterized membrane protein YhaH (DUF805 family)